MVNLLIPNNCNVNFVASQPLRSSEAHCRQQWLYVCSSLQATLAVCGKLIAGAVCVELIACNNGCFRGAHCRQQWLYVWSSLQATVAVAVELIAGNSCCMRGAHCRQQWLYAWSSLQATVAVCVELIARNSGCMPYANSGCMPYANSGCIPHGLYRMMYTNHHVWCSKVFQIKGFLKRKSRN